VTIDPDAHWAELHGQFKRVDFAIFTANLTTVAEQTIKRVSQRYPNKDNKWAEDRVIRYADSVEQRGRFESFKRRAQKPENQNTLYLIIAE
jgi:hypothetical protein